MSWADNHLFVFILLPTRKRIDNYIMWVNGDHKVLGIWDEIKLLPQYKIKMNQRYYKLNAIMVKYILCMIFLLGNA